MTAYCVSASELGRFLGSLPGRAVYAPEATATRGPQARWIGLGDPGAWVRRQDGQDPPALDRPRAAQSAKGFLLHAAEAIARYGAGATAVAIEAKPTVLVGVRACELRAWRYLDQVMLKGEFVDPQYQARREGALILSCDCVACAATCFCQLVGGKPYVEPDDGADVNLTAVAEGYVVEPLSEKGKQLLGEAGANWPQASPAQLAARGQARQKTLEQLRRQNADSKLSADDVHGPALPEGDDEGWQKFAADCVECGACTNICPTCHCFYLFDHLLADRSAERVRTWDSCLLATYHRMAGGVNMKLSPRPELRSRLANRVLHKFVYSPQQYGLLGCVGCGRCIEACLGQIDIRTVVEELKR